MNTKFLRRVCACLISSGSMTLAVMMCTATSAKSQQLDFHYQQASLTTITGHTATDVSGIPVRSTRCYAYGLGANALSEPITAWPIQDFTGFTIPSSQWGQYQRGIDNTWYGSTSGQVKGTTMGFQVHKLSGENPNPVGNIYGMQLVYNLGNNNARPFSSTLYGTGARMRMQTNFVLDTSSRTGAIQYGQMSVGLTDVTSMKSIWYVATMWDSRGPQPEVVMMDTGGTTNFNVVTRFGSGTNFSSPHPQSRRSDGSGTGNWYCVYISRTNLLAAINTINSTYGAGLSTNPNHYAMNFVGDGLEMYSPPGTTGYMGGRISEAMVITEY